jgi:hypothetical protein
MRALGDQKCQHRQPHANEHEFAIGDFARRCGYHDFAGGVAARCYLAFAICRGHRFLYRRAIGIRCASRFCFLFEMLNSFLPLLLPVKMRPAFLEKCIQAFEAIFGVEAFHLPLNFFVEQLFEFGAF